MTLEFANIYAVGLIFFLLVLAALAFMNNEDQSRPLAKVRVRVDQRRGRVTPPPDQEPAPASANAGWLLVVLLVVWFGTLLFAWK